MSQRFFVDRLPSGAGMGTMVDLPETTARQVATVLRMRPGQAVVLFDGAGGEWEATLSSVDRRAAVAALVRHRDPDVEPRVGVTLCQALLKADKFEWVLQKGTELGAVAFVPVLSRRTVPALSDEARRAARLERWRRIVVEAAEQSGRTALPRVSEPQPLTQALRSAAGAVFCWEEERERRFSAAFRRAVEQGSGAVSLFVGPEGGFAAEEAQLAAESGAQLASLGTRTLRSETAAVAALALALLEVS